MKFTEITRLWKRCEHFCRQRPAKARDGLYCWPIGRIQPEGAGIAAHNFSAMRTDSDTYLDRLLWLDALAASLNRYIDNNRIADDPNALKCMRWWRAHLFFHPGKL